MSKRDDLVPFGRHRAGKWTRISDYVRGADAQLMIPAPKPDLPEERKRVSRRGLWLPVSALAVAAAALWASGALDSGVPQGDEAGGVAASASVMAAGATSSKGVVFGLCDQGGGTNCVIDGDSFYMAGKSIQVAGIDAPETHSARCDAEALLGWAAAERLHGALNSGTVTTSPVEPGEDANGRLLRTVRVDGRDVAGSLTAAGLARPAEPGSRANWC